MTELAKSDIHIYSLKQKDKLKKVDFCVVLSACLMSCCSKIVCKSVVHQAYIDEMEKTRKAMTEIESMIDE